jgi:hypothetical protein
LREKGEGIRDKGRAKLQKKKKMTRIRFLSFSLLPFAFSLELC